MSKVEIRGATADDHAAIDALALEAWQVLKPGYDLAQWDKMLSGVGSVSKLGSVTVKSILEQLQGQYAWEYLGRVIPIRCFTHDPSMGSSLAFLRREPWARSEVEALFIRYKKREQKLSLEATGAEPAPAETDETPR